MEQNIRKKAINRYLKGESPKSIYTGLNRSKYWFFKWLKRYKTGASDWYKDKSRAPKRQPTAISEIEKERILSVRTHLDSQNFAQIGASAIKWELSKSGFNFPSDRTINRVLKREGLVKKNFVHSQRCWISIFHRSAWIQQYSSGWSCRTTIHKEWWKVLFVQCNGFI